MQDKDLIRAAKFGDKNALSELVEKYYDEVYAFLFRRLGGRSAAEDLTQETFIRFIENLPHYKEKNKLKACIFTVAYNLSNDYFRKIKRETSLQDKELEDSINVTEETVLKSEKAVVVKQAIESLPKAQMDVIILRYYHDMKISQIAAVTAVPVSTVKTKLRRAQKALADKLKGV